MTDLEVIHATGEIVGVVRMTPDQAAAWSKWVRDLMRSALTEGVDYGTFGNAKNRPCSNPAPKCCSAAGLGFANDRLDDQAARDHIGITYRCTVYRPDGSIVATCDGYCGRDETGRQSVNWNTIVKMAQKRALVGAALNATASSGLFTADLDDEPAAAPPPPPRLTTRSSRSTRKGSCNGPYKTCPSRRSNGSMEHRKRTP